MTGQIPTLWIVSPCYNEQDVLPGTTARLHAELSSMKRDALISATSRLVLVDDGSDDDTWTLITRFRDEHPDEVVGVRLAVNRGHQNALLAGMSVAVDHADAIVTIDADLQDDISVMRQMVEHYAAGSEVVYGVRRSRRSDSWFKRMTAALFYKLMNRMGVNTIADHADYRLMSRRAVMALLDYRERNIFIRGIVPALTRKTACVYYDRAPRTAGETKYTLSRMINFAVDGISSFSIKPVRMVFMMGVVFLLISLMIFAYALWSYFTGRVVSGWTSLILSVWTVGAFVLIGLGIMGEYIGKIYIEVKDRPRYNIDEVVGLP